eukprot:TRINITY_DN1949_c0_g1_i1.p1 TRINITY_DN1949_c0_g1~~TRINITY_DN1949_c0_g1_i1.p1  ORF type:complete len:475 (-),score=149.77 TRINITY_DN1949_c0_g1_i1:349-1704(-)
MSGRLVGKRIVNVPIVAQLQFSDSFSAKASVSTSAEPVTDAIPQTSLAQMAMALDSDYIVHTYARLPVVISHGKGSKLYDLEDREYIDMAGGIAVNALGHGDSTWLEALIEQAGRLAHVSNLYFSLPQIQLAEQLVNSSFADKVFFTNSGTEANEAAIKFARKVQRVKAEKSSAATVPIGFVSFSACFHGRTMGALALTSKEQYRTPFEPVMPGVRFAKYGDLASAEAAMSDGTIAAVFVEPVQGEGGINIATQGFLQGLRKLCDDKGALLVFDEVQCGLGRTGKLWAYEHYGGVTPDIMTLAKPLAGGLPIGAVLVTEAVALAMAYGDHGSTFAGSPLVTHVAQAVLAKIQSPGFLDSVAAKGELLKALLREKLAGNKHVVEVRGSGLLVGVQLDVSAGKVVDRALQKGLMLITAGKGDVLRMVPPLVITEEEIGQAVDILVEAMAVLAE